MRDRREEFDDRLLTLLRRPRRVAAHARFARHLGRHLEQWFTFLFSPVVEATNWLAEQAIRPAVVNRKVWGGNRTVVGAKAQGVLMSVMETVRRTSRSVLGYISESLRAYGNQAIFAPILLTAR